MQSQSALRAIATRRTSPATSLLTGLMTWISVLLWCEKCRVVLVIRSLALSERITSRIRPPGQPPPEVSAAGALNERKPVGTSPMDALRSGVSIFVGRHLLISPSARRIRFFVRWGFMLFVCQMCVSAEISPAAPSFLRTRHLNRGTRPGLTLILNLKGLKRFNPQIALTSASPCSDGAGSTNDVSESAGRASLR